MYNKMGTTSSSYMCKEEDIIMKASINYDKRIKSYYGYLMNNIELMDHIEFMNYIEWCREQYIL
jgi:hypothetical protein